MKLTDVEMKFCIALANRGEATKEEIAKAMGVTEGRVRHIVFGKDKNKDSGLLHKVKGLTWEKRLLENNQGHRTQKMYFKLENFDILHMFESVVALGIDSTRLYHSSTTTCTSNNNMSRDGSTISTQIEKSQTSTQNCEKIEKSNTLSAQNSKLGTNGTGFSPDTEKQGTGIVVSEGTAESIPSEDTENEGYMYQKHYAPQALTLREIKQFVGGRSDQREHRRNREYNKIALDFCNAHRGVYDNPVEIAELAKKLAEMGEI